MKKSLRIVGLALPIVLIASNSYAAVKAGSACSKAGSKSVSGGKSYTCVKSGKKLVWDKGVLVPVAQPSPSASASASASASPSPTPKASVAPAVVYPKGPTGFDDLIENYQGISYAAWSKSSAVIKGASDAAPTFKAVTGPNTTLAFKNPASAFELVSRLYTGYETAKDFTVLSFSFNDRDWATQQMKTIQANSNYPWISGMACASRETCWGGGVFTDEKASELLVLTTEILDDNHTTGTLEAHEFTHVIQQNQMRGPQPWPTTGNWPTTWYLEGQAEFSQNAAIYNQSFDQYTKNRRSVSDGLFKDSTITAQWIQDFLSSNQDSSWFSKYESWRQYDVGGMFVEALVAIKGPASTMEVWKQCGSGMKFPDAFEKVYGISFAKALPIISKAIALEIGRS
jgi:hypothetical protein